MPINPAIILGLDKPPDLLEQVGRMYGLRQQQQQMQAGALALQEHQRQAAEQEAVRQALSQSGGDLQAALPSIMRISPTTGMAIQKQLQDRQKELADIAEKESQGKKADVETQAKQLDNAIFLLKQVDSPETYKLLYPSLKTHTPELADILGEEYDPARVQGALQKAQTAAEISAQSSLINAKKPTPASLATDAADPTSPTAQQSAAALSKLREPQTPGSLEEQYLKAITAGDQPTANRILSTIRATAASRQDPAMSGLARELAGLRTEEARARLEGLQKKAEPLDVSADIQTTRKGRPYIDLSQYQGEERNKARDAAAASGAVPVSKEQANALQEIDNARANQKSILDQVKDLLPKDASGRVQASVTVPLSKLFQTNEQVAAFQSWRTAAIQTLRATAGSKGLRINQAEIAQAIENDIPKLTDTIGVAQQKVSNIETMLDNAEQSILVRDRSQKAYGRFNPATGKVEK